jgi:hypothetical protein
MAADASGNANTARVAAPAQLTGGKWLGGVHPMESAPTECPAGDGITTPAKGFPGGAGDMTVEAWVLADPGPWLVPRTLIRWSGGDPAHYREVGIGFSGISVAIGSGPDAQCVVGAKLGDGNWHHVAATLSGNQTTPPGHGSTARFYQDGAFLGECIIARDLETPPSTGVRIGSSTPSTDPVTCNAGQFPFDGVIDELRVSRRARTASEIGGAWSNVLVRDPDTVALWHFDDQSEQCCPVPAGCASTGGCDAPAAPGCPADAPMT